LIQIKPQLVGLKVKANARSNIISGYIEINGKQYLQLKIQAPAIDGKANIAIINFLAKEWYIEKRNLQISSGLTSNLKILMIKNIDPTYLKSLLDNYIYRQ
jgi:uncharacterized protein (TIGR00251 family)